MPPGTPLRRLRGALALIVLACALAPASAWGAGPGDGHTPRLDRSQPEAEGAFVPGEAIVRFEPGAAAATRRAARRRADVDFEDTLGLPRAQVVEVDGSVRSAVKRLEAQPGVAYAQPNYRYEATAVESPDDSFFADLWGLSDPTLPDPGVGVLDAWQNNRGEGQTIAVLDTGVDLTHPDLVGNLWDNPSPSKGDVHGYDFVDGDGDPDDYNFHGTHVAGTAAATAGNGEGIAGVAPAAKIMAVRVLDGDGSGSTAEIAAGIDYAADNGADVLNMSLGGQADEGKGDEVMEDAIARAGEADAVVVVAAGNEGANNDTEPHTPCALPNSNLICVAALTQPGGLAPFSNYGAETVDVAAPGTSILSAKADYGSPEFSDDFEDGLGPLWETEAFDGGVPWGVVEPGAGESTKAATDSPVGDYGNAKSPANFAVSEVFTADPVDLTEERGCRVHFRARFKIEPDGDGFAAGAFSDEPFAEGEHFDERIFDGESTDFPEGRFLRLEASISKMDGRDDVHPEFAILSDETVSSDGAYVDDARLICRDETYEDKIVAKASEYDLPESGNYVRFQGTSMATPHVAGVVALVRAAVPGLSANAAVNTILGSASPMPSPDANRPTATQGLVDACAAISAVTGHGCTAPPPPPGIVAPASAPPPAGDRTAPRTGFRRKPPRVLLTRWRRGKAVFRFRSNERGVTFLCQFDRKRYRKCGARFVRWFLHGRHVLRVRARDAAGNVDRTPAVYRFRVKQVSRRAFRRHLGA